MRAVRRRLYNRAYTAYHMEGVVRFRVKPMPHRIREWTWQLRRGKV